MILDIEVNIDKNIWELMKNIAYYQLVTNIIWINILYENIISCEDVIHLSLKKVILFENF